MGISKVFIKFSVAALAIASIVGCGSGGAKPFSASTAVAGSNTGSSTSTSASTGSASSSTSTSTTSSAPAPAPSSDPTPAGATVIGGIQNQQGWQQCGGCGNVGGTGQGPDYHMTQGISNPSLSGHAADFFVNGGPAYTGGYYFIEQPTLPNPLTYLRYEFDMYIPGQYANTPQAIEFECQQTVSGNTYNFAWQADYDSNSWRVFNYTTKQWEPTGIPLQRFAPDTWHHIVSTYHIAGTQAIHDTLIVDGQTYNANISHEATQTGTRLEFTNGFQVDLNAASTPYHVFVDN
ncbi:MAG TPA: hypothetical protein VJT08_00260, partial [Terriglobales bacterium]|nr:hypothetical protein [Terriglobales bacterium]